MSHIVKVTTEIRDLEALRAVCTKQGWVMIENVSRFNALSRNSGSCKHKIQFPKLKVNNREIGLVETKRDSGVYNIATDFYGQAGKVIQEAVGGPKCNKIRQGYAVEKARMEAKKKGYRVTEKKIDNGGIRLEITGV